MNGLGRPRTRVRSQLVTGLIVAALGVLFLLDNLEIVRARDVLRYWPAALILLGIAHTVQARTIGGMIGGSIWILFGGILLAERLDLIANALRFWPLVLVGVGAYIVWRSFRREEVMPGDPSTRPSAVAVLGGVDKRITSTQFQGAELTAFMGGGKLDLREAAVANGVEAIVDVTAVMGGYEIRVPETWNVVVDVVPFMGGYEDKTRHPADPSAPRLRVRGFVMMGGVEIKN